AASTLLHFLSLHDALPILLAGLAGCMPPHQPPPTEAAFPPPASWRAEGVRAPEISAHWWQSFGDEQLTALVEAALAHNSDVLIAASRVEQAREQIRLSHAALLPKIGRARVGKECRSRRLPAL